MDDVASTCYSTLDHGSFTLSLTGILRDELAVELQFYGLLGRVIPYYAQEQIGVELLTRACLTGEGFHSSTSQLNLSRFRY